MLKGVVIQRFESRLFGSNAPELSARDRAELRDLPGGGTLPPYLSSLYSLEEVGYAPAEMARRRTVGKVVIQVGPDQEASR